MNTRQRSLYAEFWKQWFEILQSKKISFSKYQTITARLVPEEQLKALRRLTKSKLLLAEVDRVESILIEARRSHLHLVGAAPRDLKERPKKSAYDLIKARARVMRRENNQKILHSYKI